MWIKLATFICLCTLLFQQSGVHAAPGDELWNYVEVRPGAHMFWWLMYSRAAGPPETKPLIIWLTGGPGPGATGWGNFEEVGPLDWKLNARNITWIDHAHMLFVDSPVGSGYSYVDTPDLFCTNVSQVSLDLITMLNDLLTNYAPELKTAPLYILGESFGGRMGPEFAWELYQAIESGTASANLKGLIIRDGWTSPDDTVSAYPEYMINTGMIDKDGAAELQDWIDQYLALTASEDYLGSSFIFDRIANEMIRTSSGGNMYYILDPVPFPYFPFNHHRLLSYSDMFGRHEVTGPSEDDLITLMNSAIRDKLLTRIPFLSEWGLQQRDVFEAMRPDFSRPTTNTVEKIMNNTNIKVAVVSGQLDLICCTLGTERWVDRLHWPYEISWKQNPREVVLLNELMEGYVKLNDRFSFWWINRAGHSTFFYNPQYGKHFLANFTEIPWL